MKKIISGLLILVGVIHILPLSGVLGSERLFILYGIEFNEPNVEILMRHRAVLFGLLGTFFIYSAFVPKFQKMAFIAGFISVFSFMLLYLSVGSHNQSLGKVFLADLMALISLIVASVIYYVNYKAIKNYDI